MNRVLIDTSVWIEFFKANPLYFESTLVLLDNSDIFSLELIFAELMQGAKGEREYQIINDFFRQIKILDSPGLIYQAGNFSRIHRLVSRGIGLIDAVIIFTARKYGLKVWTLDKKILDFLEADEIYRIGFGN